MARQPEAIENSFQRQVIATSSAEKCFRLDLRFVHIRQRCVHLDLAVRLVDFSRIGVGRWDFRLASDSCAEGKHSPRKSLNQKDSPPKSVVRNSENTPTATNSCVDESCPLQLLCTSEKSRRTPKRENQMKFCRMQVRGNSTIC